MIFLKSERETFPYLCPMFRQIRNSTFSRILCGFMGLYFLNISIDIADPFPEYIQEDLSFNDQESIIEIVIEKVLGFEDAIKEYDDHDPEDYNSKRTVNINMISHFLCQQYPMTRLEINKKSIFPTLRVHLTSGFFSLITPPPKV